MFSQNSKLKKDGILGFGLPAGTTCPGAGACKGFCYAQKGNFKRFPNVAKSLDRNYELTKSPDFVASVVRHLAKKRSVKFVRWHTSGDVYNQEYLDKLTKIAELLPNITFYLYTKSLHLDWYAFDKLENTSRIQSIGGIHDELISQLLPVAQVVDRLPESQLSGTRRDGSESDLVAANAKRDGIRVVFLVRH